MRYQASKRQGSGTQRRETFDKHDQHRKRGFSEAETVLSSVVIFIEPIMPGMHKKKANPKVGLLLPQFDLVGGSPEAPTPVSERINWLGNRARSFLACSLLSSFDTR